MRLLPRGLAAWFIASALLAVRPLEAGQLTVSWVDNSTNETGFKIERSTDGTNFNQLATVGANVTSFADTTVAAATAYWYRVCAYNSTTTSAYSNVTSVTTPAATTTPTSTTPGRLVHVSTKAIAAPWGNGAFNMTFGISTSFKSILLRGIGPGLAPYTTATTLSNPKLALYDGATVIASNDNWGGGSLLSNVFMQVGAFPLPANSQDAAILTSLAAKSYSATVTGKKQGMALVEIYDADTAATPLGVLTRVAVRAPVGTGEAVLVAGFAISGDSPVHLLVRAIGPSQSGLQGVLKDPQLDIYQGSTSVAHNDNWGGSSTLSALFVQVGASPLSATSKDSAIDITLAPGTYTAVVSGINATTGLARVEFFVVP